MFTDGQLNAIPGSAVLLKPVRTDKQLKFASGSDLSPSQAFTVEQVDTASGSIRRLIPEFTVKQPNAMPTLTCLWSATEFIDKQLILADSVTCPKQPFSEKTASTCQAPLIPTADAVGRSVAASCAEAYSMLSMSPRPTFRACMIAAPVLNMPPQSRCSLPNRELPCRAPIRCLELGFTDKQLIPFRAPRGRLLLDSLTNS